MIQKEDNRITIAVQRDSDKSLIAHQIKWFYRVPHYYIQDQGEVFLNQWNLSLYTNFASSFPQEECGFDYSIKFTKGWKSIENEVCDFYSKKTGKSLGNPIDAHYSNRLTFKIQEYVYPFSKARFNFVYDQVPVVRRLGVGCESYWGLCDRILGEKRSKKLNQRLEAFVDLDSEIDLIHFLSFYRLNQGILTEGEIFDIGNKHTPSPLTTLNFKAYRAFADHVGSERIKQFLLNQDKWDWANFVRQFQNSVYIWWKNKNWLEIPEDIEKTEDLFEWAKYHD
jgi:hypothetical protein